MHGPGEYSDGITADLLLQAYACGIFPMADSADDPALFWVEPDQRGILPLNAFHVPRRLARTVRSDRFQVAVDRDFGAVIAGCAAPVERSRDRNATWINRRIKQLYGELFRRGHVHTVEVRREDQLVGGLYGVSIGSAFFGESMFSFERDASKVALVHLVARLIAGGFTLLDTQFLTGHLQQFGAMAIDKADYQARLSEAVRLRAEFFRIDGRPSVGSDPAHRQPRSGKSILQLISQTS